MRHGFNAAVIGIIVSFVVCTSAVLADDHGFIEVVVPADQVWTATGIAVVEGGTVSFFGLGVVDSDDDMTDLNRLYGPAGNAPGLAPGGFPMPGYPLNCLIGKVGPGGDPFAIGTSSWEQTMPATGELYLGKNDLALAGDQGAWIVLVEVEPMTLADHGGLIEVVVPGNQAWTATGLYVDPSEPVSFFARGVIDFDNDMTDLNRLFGPAGNAPGDHPGYFPLPEAPQMCLIGKVGPSGDLFAIGTSSWNQTMSAAGELYLGVNDDIAGDNQGSWIVLVRGASPISNIDGSSTDPVSDRIQLGNASPNPFSRSTTFSFSLPDQQDVEVQVFNVAGQLIRTLYSGTATAGRHLAEWDGRDESGQRVAPGSYFYRMSSAGDGLAEKTIVLH